MPTESKFVTTSDGARLHVQLQRCTDPSKTAACLLLHGFGDGGYVWADTCNALTDTCSVAIADLRGHGQSDYPAADVYDLDRNVQDVRAMVTQLALAPLILVGHSFGGEIVLRLAAQPPVPILGAVFVDIAPDYNQEAAKQATSRMQQILRPYRSPEEYCSVLLETRPLLSEATALQLAQGALRERDGEYEPRFDPALMKYADEEFTTAAHWKRLLPAVRCRTLIVRGAGSALVSANAAKQMARMPPRAELVTVPRAGHAVMSDNPQAFCASIAAFVSSVTAA